MYVCKTIQTMYNNLGSTKHAVHPKQCKTETYQHLTECLLQQQAGP